MKIEIDTNELSYGNSEVELQSVINLLNTLLESTKKEKEERDKARKESRLNATKLRKPKKSSLVISAPKDDVEE